MITKYVIIFMCVVFIFVVSYFAIKGSSKSYQSSNNSTNTLMDTALAAGKNAGSSASAQFVPNYVIPSPQEDTSFFSQLLQLIQSFTDPEMLVTNAVFDQFVSKLTPAKLKTWESAFGKNTKFMEKMNAKNAATKIARLSKSMITNLRMAPGLITGANAAAATREARNALKAGGKIAAKAATKTAVQVSTRAAEFGAEAAAEASLGPVGAALMAVQITGMALDQFNVGGLANWEQQSTGSFDEMKREQDSQFARMANESTLRLPLIAGPLDQLDTSISDMIMETTCIRLITGITKPTNPTDVSTIRRLQSSIIKEFAKSAPGISPPVTLRDAFNTATIAGLSDDDHATLSNIAYNTMCMDARGTIVNGSYCSFSDSKTCNLNDAEFTAYVAGAPSSRSQYSEWRTKESINQQYKITIDQANACIVSPNEVRLACQTGHKGLDGKMQYSTYDTLSGRCFNTRGFCQSFGVQWDATNRTCVQNSTLKAFDFVFGSTVSQGVAMVVNTSIDGAVKALSSIGPAGAFVGSVVKGFAILEGAVMCAACTIMFDQVKILEDVFTGNFSDIERRIKSGVQQYKKVAMAIGGFFKALIHNFFDLF
jgi:hypothetical protein